MAEEPNETLTVGQLAAMLQVTTKTVYMWKSQGRLPPPIDGGYARALRWSRAVVAAWMEESSARKE